MNSVDVAKASAPWRAKQCMAEASGVVISREQLLVARASSTRKIESHLEAGLRSMSCAVVSSLLEATRDELKAMPPIAPPPGLEPPTRKEHKDSDQSSVSTADHDTQSDDSAMSEMPEYQVLIQNLPKRLMKESILRAMVKEARLTEVKKLAFRSDGKALITLTSYASLCQCILHFNGMPWFDAPSCTVPRISATYVTIVERESPSSTVETVRTSGLCADAPSFVPGALLWKSETASASKTSRDFDCCSQMSTDGGLSSDEASCGYDSGAEGPIACA